MNFRLAPRQPCAHGMHACYAAGSDSDSLRGIRIRWRAAAGLHACMRPRARTGRIGAFFDPCMIVLGVRFSRARQLPIRSSGLLSSLAREKRCGAWPSDASSIPAEKGVVHGRKACMHAWPQACSKQGCAWHGHGRWRLICMRVRGKDGGPQS